VGDAKRIVIKPITSSHANRIVKELHYSGKVAQNSQVHLGVFLDGKCGGAMQFGPSIDKRKTLGLVRDTKWNEFIELNRMAFADWLPRNSESRAIGYAMRWIKKTYPWMQWVISFADGTQCGDGTIYRASGFVLTGIKRNKQILRMPNGELIARKTLDNPQHMGRNGNYGSSVAREAGAVFLDGFQLRYVYFLDQSALARLTVPVLPFSKIAECGASMYRGQRRERSSGNAAPVPTGEGGVNPTRSLHTSDHGRQ
jgi:hypothetical protein